MFDRFDICAAYYLFFTNYHEGMGSEKYRRLSKLVTRYKYKPALSLREETLNPNEKEIYDRLVADEKHRIAYSGSPFDKE